MSDAPRLRILVVEDDPDARASLCDVLELEGFEASAAATVAEVRARGDWSAIDVAILDRRLSDGTAEELLPHLREHAPETAIVIVTGFSDVEGAITALRRGAADYLLKPINPEALRASLARIAEARRTKRELEVRAAQQSVVAEVGQLALQTSDLAVLMDEIVRRVATTLRVNGCRILELQAEGHSLIMRAGVGWQQGTVDTLTVPASPDYQPGYTLLTSGPVVVEDITTERRFTVPPLLLEFQAASGMSVIVHGEDRPFGVLVVHAATPRRFRQADVDFLQSMANVLAAFLRRSESDERAVQAERLAAIGQMVAGLAHESRNALQRSQACLEMLSLELDDRPEALELIARIQRAQDHLHHLYEEVRGYAAPIRITRAARDLRDLWRETWTHLEVARAGRDVRLVETASTGDFVCSVDRHAIEQVFRNIFENAIHACPDPGEVTIEARETILGAVPALELLIRDNGPGLRPEQHARIFEPFFTTKTRGTGLGMAIANRIVEAHGGRIRVGEPAPGGARVFVTLPRV